jgi:hypothetical protein
MPVGVFNVVVFVPILLHVLDHRVQAIKGLCAEVLCEIVCLEEGFAAIESHKGFQEPLRALQSSDMSRVMPIYSSLLEFAFCGTVQPFNNDEFFELLNTAINKYPSRPATPV